MTRPVELDPDRLLPADPASRALARDLYASVAGLPIISPHGHTNPAWFATDANFGNAAELAQDLSYKLAKQAYRL